jgi:hypothetical protein
MLIFIGKSESMKTSVTHRSKWENNIKINGEKTQRETPLQCLVNIVVIFQVV